MKFSTFFQKFLDVIFPKFCLGCSRRGTFLCLHCLGEIPEAPQRRDEESMATIACFDYKNPLVKKAIWALKYNGVRDIAYHFGRALHDNLLAELEDLATFKNFNNPLVIPIPLGRRRLQQRGFNQSELMARKLVLLDTSLTLETSVLVRIKETTPQMKLNKKDRLTNILGCFAVCDASTVENRNIILVDDVTTTGATLHEAEKVLKNAGVKKIITAVIAH